MNCSRMNKLNLNAEGWICFLETAHSPEVIDVFGVDNSVLLKNQVHGQEGLLALVMLPHFQITAVARNPFNELILIC